MCVQPMCSHAHAETSGLSRKIKKICIEIQLMLFVYIYAFVSICAPDWVCVSVCVCSAIKLQFWTEACIAFWHHLAKNEIEVLQM